MTFPPIQSCADIRGAAAGLCDVFSCEIGLFCVMNGQRQSPARPARCGRRPGWRQRKKNFFAGQPHDCPAMPPAADSLPGNACLP